MELDPKIKVKKIFDCFSDFDEVKKYFDQEVYCSNFIENFSNLKRHTDKHVFKELYLQDCKPFVCGGTQYRYILPSEFVEQTKRYRPYTLMEFSDKFTIGQPIKFRQKGKVGCERYLILNGYEHELDGLHDEQTITYVCIGAIPYTFNELFKNYEWQEHYTEDFKPFGVEVEE